jgi:hypothetical protein
MGIRYAVQMNNRCAGKRIARNWMQPLSVRELSRPHVTALKAGSPSSESVPSSCNLDPQSRTEEPTSSLISTLPLSFALGRIVQVLICGGRSLRFTLYKSIVCYHTAGITFRSTTCDPPSAIGWVSATLQASPTLASPMAEGMSSYVWSIRLAKHFKSVFVLFCLIVYISPSTR